MRPSVWTRLAMLALAGCQAPTVEVTPADARDETATFDASEDVADGSAESDVEVHPDAVVLSDGRRCVAHDEDGDGFPDDCDDCPGLADPEQKLGATGVGTACRALPPFDAASHRILFDPFFETYDASWTFVGGGVGAWKIDDTNDALLAGTALDHEYRYGIARVGAGASTTVVTAVLEPSVGGINGHQFAGIVLRAVGEPKHVVQCVRGNWLDPKPGPMTQFGVIVTSTDACTGDAGGGTDECAFDLIHMQEIPSEIDVSKPLGLRASITSGALGATSGTVQCLLFDPAIPSSVHTGDPLYIVSVELDGSLWTPAGDVGLAVFQQQSRFEWIDVLSDAP